MATALNAKMTFGRQMSRPASTTQCAQRYTVFSLSLSQTVLCRLGEYQRSWGFQLHLSNRMFDASSGRGSEVLRVLR